MENSDFYLLNNILSYKFNKLFILTIMLLMLNINASAQNKISISGNPNFGYGAGYYFANTVLSGAPSMPEYSWKDTSCSHSLILNGSVKEPGLLSGTIDNGYFRLGKILKGKKIRFGGVLYDSVFVGTNGLIGFTNNPNLSSNNPVQNSTVRPAVYPLWNDLNFSDPDVPINRLSYKSVNGKQLIITYDRAPLFDVLVNPNNFVSFQIVMDLVESTYLSNSGITVMYGDTLSGRTGTSFYFDYWNNLLHSILIGFQYSPGNELVYRFSNGPIIIVPGPIFDLSPLAVQYGPDQNQLLYNGNNGLFYPRYGIAVNGSAVEPVSFGSHVYQSNTDSFFVSKFDSSGNITQLHFINMVDHPTALACSDNGNLYVAKENGGIDKFDFNGALISQDFIPGIKATGILVNTVYDSVVYVADSVNQRVIKYNSNTGLLIDPFFIIGLNPMALILYQNYLWIATGYQNKLKVYDRLTGNYVTESSDEDTVNIRNVTSMFLGSDAFLYFISRTDSMFVINNIPLPIAKFILNKTNPGLPPPELRSGPPAVIIIFGIAVVATVAVGVKVLIDAVNTGNKIKENNDQLDNLNHSPLDNDLNYNLPNLLASETFITPTDCIPEIHQGHLFPPSQILNLKLLLQGFFNPVNNIMVRDTVRAYLRYTFPPYAIADSSKAYFNSDGTASFPFINSSDGISYYIQTKHRNSIETWSRPGGETFINSIMSYDFTTAPSQAFGNNLILKGSKYCVFSGDVNQEGHIDLTDVILVYNDAINFSTGYIKTDVNGNNITDLSDMIITYNNSINFITVIKP